MAATRIIDTPLGPVRYTSKALTARERPDILFIYKPFELREANAGMKVRSRLADIDFVFGKIEYKKDHLIIHSHPDQPMQSKVYVSPDDIVAGLGKAFANPRVWLYFLGFPYFLVRYRRRKKKK